jgi:hypothetical protein
MKLKKFFKSMLVSAMTIGCILTSITGISASAEGDVTVASGITTKTPEENDADAGNLGFVEYKFEDFCSGGSNEITFDSDYATFLKNYPRYAQCFSGARAYSNWYSLAIKYVKNSSGVFSAEPNWSSNGYGDANGSAPTAGSSSYQKGYARYQQVANKFVRIVTSAQISDVVRTAFDTESFNAQNAILVSWTDTAADIMNTVFVVVGQLLFYIIIAQTALDGLYLYNPATGIIIARKSYASQMGGGGQSRGGQEGFIGSLISAIPDFVSQAAVDVVNSSSGGHGGGGSMTGGAKVGKYLSNQWSLIILIATVYILVSTGIWPRLISFVGSFAASTLYQYI